MRGLGLLALLAALLIVGMLVRQQFSNAQLQVMPAASETSAIEQENTARPQPQQVQQAQQALENALQQSTRRLEDID